VVRERVLDLTRTLVWEPSDVRAVLERWEEALPVLHTLADVDALEWQPLDGLRVHAPVESGPSSRRPCRSVSGSWTVCVTPTSPG
jgi:hypothetical protein